MIFQRTFSDKNITLGFSQNFKSMQNCPILNLEFGEGVPATGGAGFTGLRVPEQILKLFECQSVLLKILRLYVKNNPVKLIPY